MTTINTSNALGAKVLRHFPFNGTEGEIVGGTAVTLGTGGSYSNDPTNGWRLNGDGTSFAATVQSLNIPSKVNVTMRFYGMISSTQASSSLFATDAWDGTGGGFIALWDNNTITLGVSGLGYAVVCNYPAPSRDVRHLFEIQMEIYAGEGNAYTNMWIDGVKVEQSSRTPFSTGFANNTGISSKAVQFLGWPGNFSGKGYIEDFTVFDGLTTAERASLASDPNQIFAADAPPPALTAPTVAAPAIVGTPQVGVASSYTPGAVTGNPAPATTQQWTLDGVNIAGATGATYTPVSGDATKLLRVRQIATNSQGTVNATSAAATVIAAGAQPVTGSHNLTMTNALYGAGLFGQALTGGYGTVTPSPFPADKTKDYYVQFRFKRGSAGAGAKNVIFSQAGVVTVWLDNTGNPQFSCAGGATSANAYNFFDNQFHYGMLRFIGNNIELYIDGAGVWGIALNRVTNGGYNPTASPLRIGAEGEGTNLFGGAIDMVTIGLGDPGTEVPPLATNTKQPGLIAVYAFDGNGLDTAGTPGTLPNGDLTTSDLQGQRLVLSGTTYNGVTRGKAYIFPAATNPNGAVHKSADLVVDGSTWTAIFEGIEPGNYGNKRVDFSNDAGEGVSLTEAGFSIIPISGGGDLSAINAGEALAPTTLTLTGPSSSPVNTPQAFAVGTDNPLIGSDTKTVSLSSPNGTFTPNQVTLSAGNISVDVQYIATTAGVHTLTASSTGTPSLANASKQFTASAVVVTPTAPAISITTLDGDIMDGKTATIAMSINARGDEGASVAVFADPQAGGSPISLGNATINGSIATKASVLAKGLYRLRVRITANGLSTEASTGNIRVLGLQPFFTLPA